MDANEKVKKGGILFIVWPASVGTVTAGFLATFLSTLFLIAGGSEPLRANAIYLPFVYLMSKYCTVDGRVMLGLNILRFQAAYKA